MNPDTPPCPLCGIVHATIACPPRPDPRDAEIATLRSENAAMREALEELRTFIKNLECYYRKECTKEDTAPCEVCRLVFIADAALSRPAAPKEEP